jgi:hypothetical protein
MPRTHTLGFTIATALASFQCGLRACVNISENRNRSAKLTMHRMRGLAGGRASRR